MVVLVFFFMLFFNQKQLKRNFSNDAESAVEGQASPSPTFQLPKSGAGFSVVELIVAIGIFSILTATFLFNYGSFDRRVTVDILAHQIATWVHNAQVSAMSIRRSRTGVTEQEQFRSGYGLHFDLATPNKFVYFADLNNDRVYTPLPVNAKCGDPSVECEQEITLLQGNFVSSLCGDKPIGTQSANCASVTPGSPSLYTTNTLDIVFVRPDPFTASVWGDLDTTVDPHVPIAYSHAEITVSSPKGYHHTITVWITGQVSVR